MVKQCALCLTNQSYANFHKNKNCKDGLTNVCKPCANKRSNDWVKSHLSEVVSKKKERRKDVRKSLLESAQNRARQRNIPITITLEDIVVTEYCPVLNIKMQKSIGKAQGNSPTLDRIIPELGYIPGNIQVISYKANTMKNNASKEELRKFAEWILKND